MNDCFDRLINSVILESYWNFPNGLFNYIQAYTFSRLKLLFNFYVKRTVHRQEFGANLGSHTIMALLSRTSLRKFKEIHAF